MTIGLLIIKPCLQNMSHSIRPVCLCAHSTIETVFFLLQPCSLSSLFLSFFHPPHFLFSASVPCFFFSLALPFLFSPSLTNNSFGSFLLFFSESFSHQLSRNLLWYRILRKICYFQFKYL